MNFPRVGRVATLASAAFALIAMGMVPNAQAQDRDRVGPGLTTLEPGYTIPVRTEETIDVNRYNNRVYPGRVERDVYGENGRLAIPAGSPAELMVRVAPDNDLILDLESVTIQGQRYALRARPNRIESEPSNNVIGAIVGAISGAEINGPAVRVPRDSVISFELRRPLDVGIADRGVERDGHHYHDWYGDGRDWDRR